MHELGIVIHVIRTLEETAEENNIVRIGSVTLSVGEVSGVVEEQLRDCWDYFKKSKELVKDESMYFYVSPFWRARSTFEGLAYAFPRKQFEYSEEPR